MTSLWHRDAVRARNLARDIAQQCEFLRLNHENGNEVRALLIEGKVRQLHRVSRRMEKRYRKARQEQP